MTLDYLDFDYSEDDEGTGTFDAMACVTEAQWARLQQEITQLLQKMVRQRRESIESFDKAGRTELADQERDEIVIIESFLPQQMGEDEIVAAVGAVVAEMGAAGLKDMGRVMAALRERYPGTMDFGKASAAAKFPAKVWTIP